MDFMSVMTSADTFRAAAGGALIGGSASLLLLAHGRILGVSGIVGGLLPPVRGDAAWRGWFLAGVLLAGIVAGAVAPGAFAYGLQRSTGALIVAGLLVGVGTRLGNGCTSGHGVCGISRLSPRSLAATGVFMGTGVLTVLVVQRLLGGSI